MDIIWEKFPGMETYFDEESSIMENDMGASLSPCYVVYGRYAAGVKRIV